MQIRPSLRFSDSRPGRPKTISAPVRLRLLVGGFGLVLAIIAGRVAHLQGVIADRFLTPWEETTSVLEPIPASNGRIVSADGVVLACDRTRFDLSVHYRWLEDPPNSRWLSQQARQRLAPHERRDRTKLEHAQAEVLARRADLWRSLGTITGVSETQLLSRRSDIQKRVARMAHSVETRRPTENTAAPSSPTNPLDAASVEDLWNVVVNELTSPPHRERVDPLILKEELQYHPLLSDLPLATAAAIESSPTTFPPGVVSVQRRSERVYPGKDLASHVIGVRRTGGSSGTPNSTRGGESGAEQSYDAALRGQDGVRKVVYNRRREALDSSVVRAPVDGRDVTLTIVAEVQRNAEAILENVLAVQSVDDDELREASDASTASVLPRGGTIVAIDVATGDVIAAACAPRFDLNLFNEFDRDRWQKLIDDPRRPFFPRITAMTAPPGSVFKVLTAVAALEEHAIDPDLPMHCRGYLDRPDQLRCMIFRQHGASHGDVTLSDALCQSCNVYFFEAARKMGDEPLRRWSERFGFGAPTGADLPGEAAGRLPKGPTGGRRQPDSGSTLQLAIGQSSLLVSPLQVARMMAAIANNGSLVAPRFAHVTPTNLTTEKIQLASFESPESPAAQTNLDLSPRTVAILRESLERVVSDPQGTGRSAGVTGVRVAGKTGTAETGGGQPDHAWFAGYVPADRPRIAFVVMLEHAGSGGKTAGPVARQFVEALIKAGVIRADQKPSF